MREWKKVPYGVLLVKTDKWSDEHHLAVLIVKLWKEKCKESHRADLDELEQFKQIKQRRGTRAPRSYEMKWDQHLNKLKRKLEPLGFPKGYHLNLAMHYLASYDMPRAGPDARKGITFLGVIGVLQRLLEYLLRAYDPMLGCKPEFFFDVQEEDDIPRQPFQADSNKQYDARRYHNDLINAADLSSAWLVTFPRCTSLQKDVMNRLAQFREALWDIFGPIPMMFKHDSLLQPGSGFVSLETLLSARMPLSEQGTLQFSFQLPTFAVLRARAPPLRHQLLGLPQLRLRSVINGSDENSLFHLRSLLYSGDHHLRGEKVSNSLFLKPEEKAMADDANNTVQMEQWPRLIFAIVTSAYSDSVMKLLITQIWNCMNLKWRCG